MTTVLEKEHNVFLGDSLERGFLGNGDMIFGDEVMEKELPDQVIVHGLVNGTILLALELVDTILEMRDAIVQILAREIDAVDIFKGDAGRNIVLLRSEPTFFTYQHILMRHDEIGMSTVLFCRKSRGRR